MINRVLFFKKWSKDPLTCDDLMQTYVLTGESKTLAEIYDQTSHALYHYLVLLSDAEIAADVTQKTYLRIIEKRKNYSHRGRFEAWLFTLARRILIDEFRQHSRYKTEDVESIENKTAVSEVSCRLGSIAENFNDAMKMLPFNQREAFSLQQEGFSIQEIANLTGSNAETIKTRLRYARKYLQKCMEQAND